jgi:DNA-binding NarL/FixJ family response regulator
MAVRVFIVDDHPVVVAGLQSLLGQLDNIEVAGAVSNAFDAIPFLKSNDVDVILLDINLPDISGIDLCKKYTRNPPKLRS